jgi:hypothetical protein
MAMSLAISAFAKIPAVTRLGARIDNLEKEGYVFKAEWRGGDYI